MTTIKVKVRFFAEFRRVTGVENLELELPASARVGDVVEAARARFPALRTYAGSTLVARGLDFAKADDPVREGDEISLMPPVAGG